MSTITLERTIATAPDRVFAALTQQDEIVRWWANEANVAPEEGTIGEFIFLPPAGALRFEITEMHAAKSIRWMTRQGPPHWSGTTVTWQLSPAGDGTNLIFAHEGFAQEDRAYSQTRANWDFFLDSLKSYLETGIGTPGKPRFV